MSSTLTKDDCFACKMTGAVGCFAGALFALHQRAQLPVGNKNRHWLMAIGTGIIML
jgi:hypothetical protein